MDEEIAKALKRIEDKLDLIIINTTKQKRKTPSKKIDTEQEALIDQILEMWKRLMKKPRVNINVETHRKPIRQRLSEGDYSYSDFEIVLKHDPPPIQMVCQKHRYGFKNLTPVPEQCAEPAAFLTALDKDIIKIAENRPAVLKSR